LCFIRFLKIECKTKILKLIIGKVIVKYLKFGINLERINKKFFLNILFLHKNHIKNTKP